MSLPISQKGEKMWQIVAITWSQAKDIGAELGDYQLVGHQNLAAVIANFEHPNINSLSPFERINALFNYQSILEKAGIDRILLPVRFGTMVKKKKDVLLALEKNAHKFKSLLKFAENKTEIDLMGIWKKEVGCLETNIFEDIEKKGYEIKAHRPLNRAICFHMSILVSPDEQETFTTVKKELDKRLGDRIDVRMSEPLPPYSFVTLDLDYNIGSMKRKPNLSTIKK